MVGSTELESVTSCVSSRRSNQLSYEPIVYTLSAFQGATDSKTAIVQRIGELTQRLHSASLGFLGLDKILLRLRSALCDGFAGFANRIWSLSMCGFG
jgi:hypothetical protein